MTTRFKTSRLTLCAFIAVGAIGFLAGVGFSEDAPPSDEEMMKMMMELAKPGPHHKALNAFAGEWDGVSKVWMKPGEPQVSKSRAKNSWMLGGRFMQMAYGSTFNGLKFKGIAIMGYDNHKKQYQSVWADTFSSGLMWADGKAGKDPKTFEMAHVWDGPVGKIPGRFVYTSTGKDSYTLVGYMTMGEQEMKHMEIKFTRRKAPTKACR